MAADHHQLMRLNLQTTVGADLALTPPEPALEIVPMKLDKVLEGLDEKIAAVDAALRSPDNGRAV